MHTSVQLIAPTLITRIQIVIEAGSSIDVTLGQCDYMNVDVVPRSVELDGAD